jgi:outer membrane receptor protein involved in Fe transport
VRFDKYVSHAPNPPFIGSASEPYVNVRNEFSIFDYTGAAKWTPISGISLRASYATGFLPPNVGQLAEIADVSPLDPASFEAIYPGGDPQRGGTYPDVGITNYFGGSTDLKPEKSKALSIGAIVEPAFLSGLRLSLDYTKIRKTNEIKNLPSVVRSLPLIDQLFPEQLIRAPLTANDTALGYTAGQIIGIRQTFVNVAKSNVEAWDLNAAYSFEANRAGLFVVYGKATYQTKFAQELKVQTPFADFVGFANGPLRWRFNAGLDWNLGRISAGWNMQYYDHYKVYNRLDSAIAISRAAARQGDVEIPSQVYNDIYIRYGFGRTERVLTRDLELFATVENVFDKHPPAIAGSTPIGRYSRYGDARLRRFSLSIAKHF